MENCKIDALVGQKIKSLTGLEKESEEVRVFTENGNEYLFYHPQDCCEIVNLNDFESDVDDFCGATILSAGEMTNDGGIRPSDCSESWLWTFYKIETDKGGLWMRWLGESNGYYSESVAFVLANKPV